MTNTERFTLRAAVYLLLIKDEKVLLIRRANTGWRDGEYSLVSGHIDPVESATAAMRREAEEEAGIKVVESDLKFVHVMHRDKGVDYIDFFFTADKWDGEPSICEPDKCDDMQWFEIDKLPENTVPNVRRAIDAYKRGEYYSEFAQ
jgi:8-oxo-dGTP diphosphatase